MALTIEQFGKALAASGLMTPEDVRAFWNAIPAAERPKDADGFAQRLRAQKLLTEFQAKQLLEGKGASLVMGDYAVLAEIGAGGMGQVYKARHRRMERIVALKVMSSAAMKDEAAVKRFQREVRAAARLEHPNIVTAYDSGEAGSVKYLVMQFVDGGDLSDLVKKNGPLPIEKAVDYVLQAARGLAFAHAEGVIHRDIKPANLLLDKKGVVKILDMGLARIESSDDGLTATEQVMGTVDYMSPEQAANTKGADGRADIYSLGCTLWYLLTGKKAYEADTMIARLMAHREAPLPSLVKTRDDAPWALEQVLHKMLAKRPQDRFQSMDEVVTALEPFSGGSSKTGMGSSIGMGTQTNAELAAFFQNVGPKTSGPSTKTGGPKTEMEPKSATSAGIDATAAFLKPEADTDPKSQLLAGTPLVNRAAPVSRDAKQSAPVRKKNPPVKLIAGGVLGVVLLVVAGVIIKVRDKDGNVVAELEVPNGATVEVTPTDPAATAPASIAAAPTISPSKMLESREYVWAAPENLGLPVNTVRSQSHPTLTADELCLICVSQPEGNFSELVECVRPSIDAPFGPPKRLTGATKEREPCLSADGLTLIYASEEDSFGKHDLWIRRRASIADDWGKPLHLLQEVNSADEERSPRLTLDGLALMFSSDRPGGMGKLDIWIARRKTPTGSFERAVNLDPRLNSPDDETEPMPLGDGQLLFQRNDAAYYLSFKAASGISSALPVEDMRGNDGWLSPDARRWYFSGMSPTSGRDIWMVRRVPTNSTVQPTVPSSFMSSRDASPPPGDYALLFDGSSNVVVSDEVPYSTEACTIEAYVRPDVYAKNSVVCAISANARLGLDFTDGKKWLLNHDLDPNGHFALESMDQITLGHRVHIAGVYDKSQFRLYVDGKVAQTRPTSGAVFQAARGSPHFGDYFRGLVDEVRFSNRVRYTADFTPPARHEADADTLALYHFDEGGGHELRDTSGNNRHGFVNGSKWVKADGSPIPSPGGWTYGPVKPLFDGTSLAGWSGDTALVSIENGVLVNDGKRGVVMAPGEYRNFEVELDFRLAAVGNSGLGIFYPGDGDPAAAGLEVQLLDDAGYPNVHPKQRCGSLYQVSSATTGQYRAWPEWNHMVVRALGDQIEVVLNDTSILKVSKAELQSSNPGHAGLKRESGKIALFPHTGRSEYRNFRVREATLDAPVAAQSPPPPGDYALDFSKSLGGIIPSLNVNLDEPFTIEVTATPLDRPNTPTANSPLVNLGWLQLKQYCQSQNSTFCWSCVSPDVNNVQTTMRAGDCVVGKPGRIAVVSTGKELRTFLDGKLVATAKTDQPKRRDRLSSGIGRYAQMGDWRAFHGLMDEVRISKVARYDKDYTPQARLDADPNTLALYHFDEGSGSTIKDSSGNGYDATIPDAKWVRADGGPITASPANVVYLDDLTEKSWHGYNDLGKHGKGVGGAILSRAGERIKHSLMTPPTKPGDLSFVEYELGGRYEKFEALTYLTREPTSGPQTFRVLADGKKLWESPPQTLPNVEADFSLSIQGVNLLRLEVAGIPSNSHPLWLEPRLTPSAAAGAVAAAAADHALQFDGKSAHVVLPLTHDVDSPLTIEATLLPGPWKSAVVSNSEGRGIGIDLDKGAANSLISRELNGVEGYVRATAPQPLDTSLPHRLAAVYDGTKLRLFVDGKLQATTELKGKYLPSPLPFIIGASPEVTGIDYPFTGTIDEVRISKSARYTQDYVPKSRLDADADTLALYHFDDGSGDVLRDASGNGRDGKIVGATWVPGEAKTSAVASSAGGGLDLSAKLNPGAARVGLPQFLDREKPITVELIVTPRSLPGATAKNRKLWQFEFFDLKQYGDQWEWLVNIYGDDGKRLPALAARGAVQPGIRANLAGVWTGKELRFFVDGKLIGSTTVAKLPAPLTYNSHSLGGKHEDSVDYGPFDGILHEARISQTARYDRDYIPADRLEADANTAALYRCDEGTGDVLRDSSGHGRDGKIIGATWIQGGRSASAGATRNALQLNGAGYVDLASDWNYDGSDLTFEAWLISDTPHSTSTFLAVDHDAGGRRHAVRLSRRVDGIIEVARPSEQLILRFDDTLPSGRPTHFAAVWQGPEIRVYVDGKRLTSRPHHYPFLPRPSKPYAWLGGLPADESLVKAQQACVATLLETRITSRARYQDDFTPPARLTADADTVSRFQCDEGAGDVLRDSSGHGRNGKVFGAKWVHNGSGVPGGPLRPALVAGQSVDLLAQVDPARDARVGAWKMADGVLNVPSGGFVSLELPVDVAPSFRLDLTATRLSGGKGLTVGFPVDGHDTRVFFDSDVTGMGRVSSLDIVDGLGFNSPQFSAQRYLGEVLNVGKPISLTVEVTPNSVTLSADGKQILQWQGRGSSLSINMREQYQVPPRALWLGSMSSEFTISKLTYTPEPRGAAGGSRSLSLRRFASDEWVDVLPLIDPAQDKVDLPNLTKKNDWSIKNGELTYTDDGFSGKLLFPIRYSGLDTEWEIEFTRTAGGRNFNLDPLTPGGTGVIPIMTDENGGGAVLLGGKNIRIGAAKIETGKRSKIRCISTVDPAGRRIQVFMDERQVGDWKGDPSTLIKPTKEPFDPSKQHGIWVHRGSTYVFHSIRARGLLGTTIETVRPATDAEGAATPLFNGADFAGWKGDPKVWSWENNQLVGKLSGNGYTFLAGTKPYQDFELVYEVKLQGDQANSGIQFRSEMLPPSPYDMTGPQCEIGGTGKTGYGGLWWEKGPANGVKSAVPPEKYGPLVKPDDYNRMTVRCVGKHVTITLNGTTTVDGDFEIPAQGQLGFQIVSRGPPVEMRVRNITFRDLSAVAEVRSVGDSQFALQFNGVDSDVSVPSWKYRGDHPLTAEVWFVSLRSERERSMETILGDPQLAGFSLSSNVSNNRSSPDLRWGFMFNTGQYQSVAALATPTPEKLTHYAGVYDGKSEIRFYVDGKLQGRTALTGAYRPSTVPFAIGANYDNADVANENFLGRVYEVRLSKTARYSEDFAPQARFAPDPETIALYHFDAGAGNVLTDYSGNGHHGKILGARWVRADGSPLPGVVEAITPPPPAAVPGGNNALALDETTTGTYVPRLRYDGSHPLTIEAWTEPRQAPAALRRRIRHLVMHPLLQLNYERFHQQWTLQSQTETTKYYQSEAVGDPLAPGLVHVAAVLADGTLKCFVDGKLRLSEPLNGRLLIPPLVPKIDNDSFQIGQGPEGSPTDFEGIIDELRISRTARYSDDFTPAPRFEPDADTLALYHFDEGTGTAAADASGNGYHLHLKDHSINGRAPGWCAAPAPRASDPKAVPERLVFGDAVEGTFGGHRYLLVRSKAVWKVAKAEAEARGGHLVSITSAEENNWLKEVLLQTQPQERIVWIGATRPDRSQPWSWQGGEPWGFADWREKEGSDGEAGAMAYSRPLDGSEARRGWGDWSPNNPPMALSGEIQGRTRAWGYVIEWDNLEPRKTDISVSRPAASVVGVEPASKLFLQDPGFEPWLREVQGLPIDRKMEAVSKKLRELNPGFDGVLLNAEMNQNAAAADGVLRSLGVNVHQVRDVSPLRALSDVRYLTFGSPGYRLGKLSDLSPLRGLALANLNIQQTIVSELSPLAECKSLATLTIKSANVTAAGIDALRQALPNCSIQWDGTTDKAGEVRRTAEWILSNSSKGWALGILFDQRPLSVVNAAQLPAEPFIVNTIHMQTATDDDLARLRSCDAITSLFLSGAPITDAGTAHLKGMKRMKILDLARTAVSDASMPHVAGLTNLDTLRLADISIGDQGLSSLHPLTMLKTLNVKGTRVTAEGVAKLQKALPDCKIEWDGAVAPAASSTK
ncbi:MAG: hypothetical protein C0483_08155 [Pirellula sp.]|nr:hypothetical protein [Pirellula sp.]